MNPGHGPTLTWDDSPALTSDGPTWLFGPNWSLGRPKWSLGCSEPTGPWAVRAHLVTGPFGPNWSLGHLGPIRPQAVWAQLDPWPFGPNWTLGRSGPIAFGAIRAYRLGMSLHRGP